MCGIAGFVTKPPSSFPASVIREMTDAIRHRGPDDVGYYADAFASLGHRRVSIVDLATGHQPMFNEDRNLCLIYNGEIFNHADLRPALERAGHRYVSRSDTETILHAYEQHGADCVDLFRGMFAFAIWDSDRRTLFCARDRLGIKPFYYYWDGRLFAFASEIKALLRHPSISVRLNESVLPEYLAFGYLGGDSTFFEGIHKLMPGHRLQLTAAGLQIEQYWDIPGDLTPEQDDTAWIRECRRRLEETVRMRLMSDVPLGMFLSGGVDSSALAALAARMIDSRLKTFSVGYAEASFSELGYASRVAEAIGTDHKEIVIGFDDFFSSLPNLVWHEDEPIVWPASVSLYHVSRLASRDVKVVLTGEGADELFGGYERYRYQLLNDRLMDIYTLVPGRLRGSIRERIDKSAWLGAAMRRKVKHTVLGRDESLESLYLDNFLAAFTSEDQRSLLRNPAEGSAPYASVMRYWSEGRGRSLLNRLLYTDQKTYLVELLMKQDQMSMAASIESRVPFLDHPLVEFAATVPDRLKIRSGSGKYVLKRAVEDLLPKDITYRKKMGFPTPLRAWLREPRAVSILSSLRDPDGLLGHYVNMPVLNALLERHTTGELDATDRIWRLLNLQVWGQVFLTGVSPLGPHHHDCNLV